MQAKSAVLTLAGRTATHTPRPDLFTPADAARELGIAARTVRHHIAERPRLFPQKVGGRWEWDESEYPEVLSKLRKRSPKARRGKTTSGRTPLPQK